MPRQKVSAAEDYFSNSPLTQPCPLAAPRAGLAVKALRLSHFFGQRGNFEFAGRDSQARQRGFRARKADPRELPCLLFDCLDGGLGVGVDEVSFRFCGT